MAFLTQRPRHKHRPFVFAIIGITILTTVVVVAVFALKRIGIGPLAATYLKPIDLTTSQKTPSVQLRALEASQLITIEVPLQPTGTRNAIVYLPVGYVPKPKFKYPTVYLLHGSPGKESDWIELGNAQQTLDRLIQAGTIQPLIAVFPDGNGGLDRDTQYINATDGSELDEDFIWQQLVSTVDSQFPTLQQAKFRAIGGLSSGAFGAINIGLKHQAVFGKVIALSGYGRIEQNDQSALLIQGSKETIATNSPLDYIPKLTQNSTQLWLADGDQDSALQQNRALETALRAQHFQVEFQVYPGKHDWDFWSVHLSSALTWLGALWKS